MTGTATPTELARTWFFVDGEWVVPQGSETHRVIEAATGEPIGTAALGTAADIDAAALAARAADTSRLVTRENGMPIWLSEGTNGVVPPALLRMYADLVEQLPFEEIRPSPAGATIVRREPVGVVGAITPWNYPQALAMFKIAPALAAGCTVVLKPSPEAALDSYVFADAAAEAGLPPGVLNIVLAGREASRSLVSHPLVDKIGFTGSTAAGRAIGAECGRLIRRCTLELGGKSAAIVLDDADLDLLRVGLRTVAFQNNSQTCTTQSRILAPRSRYADVVDAVAQYCTELIIGDPLDPATTLGPMVSEAHRDRVLGYIGIGRASGARLVTGGGRPAGQDRGWFAEPTVFAG